MEDANMPHRIRDRRPATVAQMNALNASTAYTAWLGAEVLSAEADEVRVRIPWRVEFAGAPGMTHGGVLAGVIDLTAYMVLMAVQGGAGPTIDMRVDFHRSTVNQTFFAVGKLLRAGATISTVDVRITDAEERLIASGRGVFLSQSRQRDTTDIQAVKVPRAP
jgi:uncharacterized protein (TIGR00369 family)